MRIMPAIIVAALAAAAPARGQETDRAAAALDLLRMLSRGEYPGAVCLFDDALRAAMPAGALAKTCSGLVAKAGRFEYIGPAGGGAGTVRVLCVFEKGAYEARVDVDDGGKVVALAFSPAPTPSPAVRTLSIR